MNLVLIVSPDHSLQAAKYGLTLAHLAYGLGGGELYLTVGNLGLQTRGGYLGLCDDVLPQVGDPDQLAAQVLAECRRRRFCGVLADFEREPGERTLAILGALERALGAAGLDLLVPEAYGGALPRAQVLICSAISGGKLTDYLAGRAEAYPGRAVLELRRLRMAFPLPCPAAEGEPIGAEALQAVLDACPAYYSESLGCNYVTSREGEEVKFILYDTPGTLRRKLALAEELGYSRAVMLYPEAVDFLETMDQPGTGTKAR